MADITGKILEPSERTSDKYLVLNNCGFYDRMSKFHVIRQYGRLDYQLLYVYEGEMALMSGDTLLPLSAGDIALYHPYERQEYYPISSNVSYCWLHFIGSEVENMLGFFKKPCYFVGGFNPLVAFCRSYCESYPLPEHFNELIYTGELIQLFGQLHEKITHSNSSAKEFERIKKAIRYINENLCEKTTNSKLSELCCLSPSHFIKLFKSSTGMSPQAYRTALIIEKSKLFLSDTSLNIGEVSNLLGINDSLYFSRMFKKHTALSPTHYRNSL